MPSRSNIGTLRLILGDQLDVSIATLADCNKHSDVVLLCEVWDETQYVKHHKKKIAFLFSAMRHFAERLRKEGYRVDYIALDDAGNSGSFKGEVKRAVQRHGLKDVVVTFPGEYRVLDDMKSWSEDLGITLIIRDDDRFLCTPHEFYVWAHDRKGLRMEYFYREMRRKYNILMDSADPVGGAWNFDKNNRKPLKANTPVPSFVGFASDDITQDVLNLVSQRFADHFGDLEPFDLAVTREQALVALERFIHERLPLFGDYQDAMQNGTPFLYHSHLSFYLNCGLLRPLEVVQRVEQAYYDGHAPLNAVEGYIRQIIGWREYVRGIYWLKMPEYKTVNALNAQRALPWFYWSGETDMNCMRNCIDDTKRYAYAHHIQRLMVLGNYALLAGIHPDDVNEWYLVVYADAYEWVELPNVSGMILFADGGYLGSKPYAASGKYINRMSDYCKTCRYNVNETFGETACPFNRMYWNFLLTHADRLRNNPRVGPIYSHLDRMSETDRQRIQRETLDYLNAVAPFKVISP